MAAMRALKNRSGLTLRQMEERATAQGDVLARSTVADLLRRQTLPRPELLAAFVRACGEQDRLGDWMGAYERLVREATATEDSTLRDAVANASTPGAVPTAGRKTGVRASILAVVIVLAAVATAVVLLTTMTGAPATRQGKAETPAAKQFPRVLALSSAGNWVRIRPARTPELCLTAGKERSGRYRSEVAVQLPCTDPGGPRTFLQPIGDDVTEIKWEHPVDKGMGCLTLRNESPAKDMLEPEEDCRIKDEAQLFRIEHFDAATDDYRLRRAHTDFCVGIGDDDTASGAEAIQQPCSGAAAQRFRFDLDV
jgi:hypothetical protein